MPLLLARLFRSASIPIFHAEYARFMLEATPGLPQEAILEDLLEAEANMRYRNALELASQAPRRVLIKLTPSSVNQFLTFWSKLWSVFM